MKMHVVGVGLAVLALTVPASAKDEAANKAVKRVTKSMSKLKSYRVRATVQGGMAQGADHKITASRVNESYRCEVNGNLAHIVGNKEAFRLRAGKEGQGTIKDSGVWKAILVTPEGKVIERLFQRPEHHFAKMNQFKKLAKWLPADPADTPASVPELNFDFGDSDDEEVAKQPKKDTKKTRVRKGKTSKSKVGEDGPVSHRFRIVGPTNEAINQFTTIVNSGCLGGG